MAKKTKTAKTMKKAPMSFKDIIGDVRIQDNIIITPDGRYITIVEVTPINFDYKTALDKERIIDAFAQFTKIGPVTMQIKSLSRRADTNKYINVLRHDFALERDAHLRPYQEDYMRLIRRLGVYSGLSRRFFIVFEACGTDTEKIKNIDDGVEAYYKIEGMLDDKYFEGRKRMENKVDGEKKEVILSCYLKGVTD